MNETVSDVLKRLSPKDFPHDPVIAGFVEKHRDAYIYLCENMGGTKVSFPKISTLVGRIMSREEREPKHASIK